MADYGNVGTTLQVTATGRRIVLGVAAGVGEDGVIRVQVLTACEAAAGEWLWREAA